MQNRLILSVLFLISFFLPMKAQELVPIRQAYEAPAGSLLTIEGIINTPDFGIDHSQFFVQDTTGGIKVFFRDVGGANGAAITYDEGDLVRIEGQISVSQQQIEIHPKSIERLEEKNTLPEPIKINPSDLNPEGAYHGMRVEISNVILTRLSQWPTSPRTTNTITQLDAEVNNLPFIIRIESGQSFMEDMEIPNEAFTLRGILTRTNHQVYISPFYESDIILATTTNTFEALKLDNNLKVYPNPVKEEITLEILAQAGTVDRIILSDLLGRTVAQYTGLNARNQVLRLPVPASVRTGQYFLIVWTENGLRTSKIMAIKK